MASLAGNSGFRARLRYLVPLHITLSCLLLGMIGVAAGGLITYSYYKSQTSALLSARKNLSDAANNITLRTQLYLAGPLRLAETASDLPEVSEPPTLGTHSASIYMLRMLREHPQIFSAYMGFENGAFFQIFLLNGKSMIDRSDVNAPPQADFAIRRILRRDDGRRVEIWQYLNDAWDVVGSSAIPLSGYNPTVRPWYRSAIGAQHTIYTPPYRYETAGTIGFTLARRFESTVPGVFGVDLALSALSGFVKEQSDQIKGQIVLFDAEGRVWAHPDMEALLRGSKHRNTDAVMVELPRISDVGDPVLSALYRSFVVENRQSMGSTQIDVEGRSYVAEIKGMSDVPGGTLFVLASAPVSVFTAPFDAIRIASLLMSLLFVGALIPFVYLVSRSVSRPLRELAAEANAIRDFELERPLNVPSIISEVHRLSASMAAMKTTIGTFAKFVPRDLVKRLISTGEGMTLGGTRRDITVMFTDAANFTRITENMSPEDVMRKLSSYMEKMTVRVMESGGVIDKFTGDGLMALWNAPENNTNHMADACRAALLCRSANEKLNAQWQSWGWEVMETRFGLHTGETVVGTMGSSYHMAYTAIGAVVNLASRLEGLNKFYGTQILVSADIAKHVDGEFLLRFVDYVAPKGTSRPLAIYELVGALAGCTGSVPDIVASDAEIAMVDAWAEACRAYSRRDWSQACSTFLAFTETYPEDKVAVVYLERCRRFQEDAPPPDWDGVDRHIEK
ncbi:MAG: adenylate/guanylate cyclase domain-containing protein [Rhodospirillales bacterium]